MLIEITEKDIKEGKCSSFYNCALAKALKRIFDEKVVVRYREEEQEVVISIGKTTKVIYNLDLFNWLIDFDRKNQMSPFSFELNF